MNLRTKLRTHFSLKEIERHVALRGIDFEELNSGRNSINFSVFSTDLSEFSRLSFEDSELRSLSSSPRHCSPHSSVVKFEFARKMHPPLTLHRHPMCAEIIEQFQKCHTDHPVAKFFGECTNLKIQLDRCFRQEKALKRKANFEESKKLRERLQAYRKETALEESS